MSRAKSLLLLVALLLASACGSDSGGSPAQIDVQDDDGYAGTLLPRQYRLAPVTLGDTSDRPFTLARDDKDLDVVFFGYTNCPDVCRVVMATIANAYLRLDEADRDRVRVVFVTTDPARDDARELQAYLQRYNPDFTGLTGPLGKIDQLGKSMRIFITKGKKLPGGGYEVDHTTSVTAVRHGAASLVWTNGVAPQQMADDITKLLEAS